MTDFNTSNPFDAKAAHEAALAESRRRQEAASRGEHRERVVAEVPVPAEPSSETPAMPARQPGGALWDPVGERPDMQALRAAQDAVLARLRDERAKGPQSAGRRFLPLVILVAAWAFTLGAMAADPFLWNETLLFLPLGALTVVVIITSARAYSLKNDARKLQFAQRHGWQYRPTQDAAKVTLLTSAVPALFGVGHSPGLEDEWWGALQIGGQTVDAWMGEFQYTTGSGKNSTTHQTHAVALRLPRAASSPFGLTPDAAVMRLFSFFKDTDVELGAKEFDDAFKAVYEGDKAAAEPLFRRVFGVSQQQSLLALKARRGMFSLAVRGDALIFLFYGRSFFLAHGKGGGLTLGADIEQGMERDLAALAADLAPVYGALARSI